MTFIERLERARTLIKTRVEPEVVEKMRLVIKSLVSHESRRVIVELLQYNKSLIHLYPLWMDPCFECRTDPESSGDHLMKVSMDDSELANVDVARVIGEMVQKHVLQVCDETMIAEFDGTHIVNYMTLYQGSDISSIHYKVSLRDHDVGYEGNVRVLQ